MNLNDVQYVCGTKQRRKEFKVTTLHNGLATAVQTTKRTATSKTSDGRSTKSHNSVTNTSNATSATNHEGGGGVILAITEGRGEATCEVGLCAFNVDHPELHLFQISDTSSYRKVLSKVMLLHPREILVPATFTENRLVDALIRQFSSCKIQSIDRSAFRKDAGLLYVRDVCSPVFNSILIVLQYKYYALAATGALRIFLETYKRIHIAKETLKVNYGESDCNMMIDVFVADKLELVACAAENTTANLRRQSSLRGILNHCMTKLGSRLLRSTILQPPNKQEEINSRLNCVEELVMCPDKLIGIRESLKKVVNFGQVLSLATLLRTNAQLNDERQMNYILLLNNFFEEIEPLKEILESCKSNVIKEVNECLNSTCFHTLHTEFKGIIHDDARPTYGERADIAKCFAVRSGKSVILDMLRKKYSDRLDDIREHVKELSRKMGQDLKLGNNVTKGYHVVMPISYNQRRVFDKSSLPTYVCQVDVMSTMVTMKTITLLTLSNRLQDTNVEIIRVCNEIIQNLLLQVQNNIAYFYEMCEKLAKLDLLQSFAHASTSMSQYVRPTFDDYTRIIDGRHPMLDYLLETRPTPNDVIITSDHRLNVITGPNGSGKSVYIRQIVLLQVMAQIGCYVPAAFATFRICDQILARIFFEDKMECAVSTFALEMNDVKHFVNVSNDRTLVIIDELCRSTAVCEGTALAMAICESLIMTGATVFITTHYTYMTKLQQMHPNVTCWQLETNVVTNRNAKPKLHFTRKVIPGVVTLDGYGVALARIIWHNDVMDDVDSLLPLVRDKALDTSISKPLALKINLENELRDLKLKGKYSEHVAMSRLANYFDDLKSFGINVLAEPETFLSQTEEQNNASHSTNLALKRRENDKSTSNCYNIQKRRRNERDIRSIMPQAINIEAVFIQDNEEERVSQSNSFAVQRYDNKENVRPTLSNRMQMCESSEGQNTFGKPDPINLVEAVFSQSTEEYCVLKSKEKLQSSFSNSFKNKQLETVKSGKTLNRNITILQNCTVKLPKRNNNNSSTVTATSFLQEEKNILFKTQANDNVVIDPTDDSIDMETQCSQEDDLNFTYNTGDINTSDCHEFLKKCDKSDIKFDVSFLNNEKSQKCQINTLPLEKDIIDDSLSSTKLPFSIPNWKTHSASAKSLAMDNQLPPDSFFDFDDNFSQTVQEITTSFQFKHIEKVNLLNASITSTRFKADLNVGRTSTPVRELVQNNSRSFDFSQPGPSNLKKYTHNFGKGKLSTNKLLHHLSKRDIEDSYKHRRKAMLQTNDIAEAEAYYEEIINRPSLKQIQAAEVVISAKKGSNGDIFLDAPHKKKARTMQRKRFCPPFKFDGTIFSDKNFGIFDKFLTDTNVSK